MFSNLRQLTPLSNISPMKMKRTKGALSPPQVSALSTRSIALNWSRRRRRLWRGDPGPPPCMGPCWVPRARSLGLDRGATWRPHRGIYHFRMRVRTIYFSLRDSMLLIRIATAHRKRFFMYRVQKAALDCISMMPTFKSGPKKLTINQNC